MTKKILAISFEPWQTEMCASINTSIQKQLSLKNCGVFVTDTFQVTNIGAKKKLDVLKGEFKQDFWDISQEYYQWQKKDNSKNVDYSALVYEWQKNNKINESTKLIEYSDHVLNHYEREPYYKKLTESQKAQIVYDLIVKTEKVIEELQPTFVWCLEKSYSVKFIAYIICKNKGIPFLTLIGSRIENLCYIHPCFGMGGEELTLGKDRIEKKASIDKAELYIKNTIQNKKSELYASGTSKRKENIAKGTLGMPEGFLVNILSRLKNRDSREIKGNNIYNGSWFLRFCYMIFKQLRILRFRFFGDYHHTEARLDKKKYFLYPLHARPESSILVLGNGYDDELAIQNILTFLPLGVCLVLKENPSMVELRKASFYKKFKNNKNLIFAPTLSDSRALIEKSLGVISISGTMLLEAAILGKPAYAIGNPEFVECLDGHGIGGLKRFLIKASNQAIIPRRQAVKNYLSYIFSSSQEIPWKRRIMLANVESRNKYSDLIAKMFVNYYETKL